MAEKLRVGIMGATGTVGQRFIELLKDHPWFEVTALAASPKSAGKPYSEALAGRWKMTIDIPPAIAKTEVKVAGEDKLDCDFVFSGLDSDVAGPIEETMAGWGYPVISNSKNHRYDDDVPLLIPEVNPGHTAMIPIQQKNRGYDKGFITTNPNCACMPFTIALKPIADKYKIKKVMVATMQAVSGAGYPGVSSLDILDNVIPFIGGEEPKVEREPLKMLGKMENDSFADAEMTISAMCHRIPTIDGHMIALSVELEENPSIEDIIKAMSDFRGEPQELKLPFAPNPPIIVRLEENRPQTRYDRDHGKGMAISVGRVRPCPILTFKCVILGHNTIRGAAGAAVLNAELLKAKGFLG